MYLRFVAGDNIEDTFWANGIITIANDLAEDQANWSENALSWFKDSSNYFILLARELAEILKAHDIPTQLLC